MEVVPIEFFGIAIEVPFGTPFGFHQANLEEFASKLCDPTIGLNLRPNQIRLRRTDDLFDYELSAHFFGENGTLTRGPDRIKLAVRNARNMADWNLIHQLIVRFYHLMDFVETTVTTLSIHAHGRFPSQDDRDGFLSQFSHSFEVLRPASLAYVRIVDWEKDIRVLLEQSNMAPHAVFAVCDTQFQNLQDWDSFLSTLPTVMENSVNIFGLAFEPLKSA